MVTLSNSTYALSEPPILVSYSVGDDGAVCELDVANILTGSMSPRKGWSIPSEWTDSSFRERNLEVDARLWKMEKWIRNTKQFDEMRSQALKDADILYPSDHFDYAFTRDRYISIHSLETQVISRLYERMQDIPCFSPVIKKYDQMNREVAISRQDRIEQIRIKKMNEQKGKRRFVNITSEQAERELNEQMTKTLIKYQREFRGVKRFSDYSPVCDACFRGRLHTFTVSDSLPNHFRIRKWVGNVESREIYTDANRYPFRDS